MERVKAYKTFKAGDDEKKFDYEDDALPTIEEAEDIAILLKWLLTKVTRETALADAVAKAAAAALNPEPKSTENKASNIAHVKSPEIKIP